MSHVGGLGDVDGDVADMHGVSDIDGVGMTDIAYFLYGEEGSTYEVGVCFETWDDTIPVTKCGH